MSKEEPRYAILLVVALAGVPLLLVSAIGSSEPVELDGVPVSGILGAAFVGLCCFAAFVFCLLRPNRPRNP